MGCELSLYLKPRKSKKVIFLTFYTSSSPVFECFKDLYGCEELTINEEDNSSITYKKLDDKQYLSVFTSILNKIEKCKENISIGKEKNKEIISCLDFSSKTPIEIYDTYNTLRSHWDEEYIGTLRLLESELNEIKTIWEMVKDSKIQPDGIEDIYFLISW